MSELSKILNKIGDFDNKESRDQYLKSKGHDLSELDKDALKIFKKISSKNKLKEARKRKALFNKASKLLVEKSSKNITELVSSLSNRTSSEFAYQFSKLENIPKEDIISMLNDEELLKLIEKLED